MVVCRQNNSGDRMYPPSELTVCAGDITTFNKVVMVLIFWVNLFSWHLYYLHCKQKTQDTRLLFITSQNADQFSKLLNGRFISTFAIKSFLNIPQKLKGIATLPCEILRSENSNNLKHVLWLLISDKSQGSIAAHLRCGGLVSYHLTVW